VRNRGDPVMRAVLTFALLGIVVLTLVGVAGMLVLRRIATNQAIGEARQLTGLSARVVEQRLTNGFLTGDARASGAVAEIVHDAVLRDPVVRVKIWSGDGTILYSDQGALIGDQFRLDPDEEETLAGGQVVAELSNLDAPENRFERPFGKLLEVYARIQTPDGTPLLFETYQRFSSIADSGSDLLTSFAPVLIVALIAFALLEVPLAWGLARRVRGAQADRERYLQQALDASGQERRRIAGDLHDGPVQELAGLAMRVSAQAEATPTEAGREALRETAGAVRATVRTLRSVVVGVHPPNLQQAGLGPAIADLTARLASDGLDVNLDVVEPAGFGADVDALLYRACQEALRNVEVHAGASRVSVSVRREDGRAVLEVVDDGRGIDADRAEAARAEGHVGISIVADMVADAGGTLTLLPVDAGGTVVRVEVPIR
jgi:two-component system NarL family sensor kinase